MKSKNLYAIALFLIASVLTVGTACKDKNGGGTIDPKPNPTDSVVADNATRSFTFSTETATLNSGTTRESRLLNPITTTSILSKYGGWKSKKTTAKGFFYPLKTGDKGWVLVDPEGYYFLTVGVNSVEKLSGQTLPDSLWSIGANTMGSWADETVNTSGGKKMPYCPRWNLMLNFKNTNAKRKALWEAGIIPVFDPEFPDFADENFKPTASYKNDPYVLGHFTDNELPIYDNTTYGNLLDRFLAIADKTDPNQIAAKDWIVARKGANYTIAATDREEFHGYVAGTYYRIANEKLKKHDPNHLNLGSRLHGGARKNKYIFREAGKYVDVISVNAYSAWNLLNDEMDVWANESNKPFFITEFYAKAQDTGLPNLEGAGFYVKTQADRARFFENFTLALLEHKNCVGFHHFRHKDHVDINTGLVNAQNKWHELLKNSYHKIAKDIYFLRESMVK